MIHDAYAWSFAYLPAVCLLCVLIVTVVNVLVYREVRAFVRRHQPPK